MPEHARRDARGSGSKRSWGPRMATPSVNRLEGIFELLHDDANSQGCRSGISRAEQGAKSTSEQILTSG